MNIRATLGLVPPMRSHWRRCHCPLTREHDPLRLPQSQSRNAHGQVADGDADAAWLKHIRAATPKPFRGWRRPHGRTRTAPRLRNRSDNRWSHRPLVYSPGSGPKSTSTVCSRLSLTSFRMAVGLRLTVEHDRARPRGRQSCLNTMW